MPILNYTTSIDPHRTVGEIQKVLAAALMREHLWDPDDLITETCEAFEAKHLGVQA